MPELELDQFLNHADELVAHLCRRSFADFVKEFWAEVPGAGEVPDWNWHMDVICHELQKVAERVFRGLPKEYDLVCNISPGTSKSTLFSILFPAWTWTRMPSCRHLSATHTDMLALDLASKSRAVVKSEKYRRLFPDVVPRDDQDTKSYFANTRGGDRLTCTVGGKSPMGFHAHFITVDDPIDPKKVMSELELKTAKEFMTQVIPTRKVDKAVSVTFLVMQRLHEDDPAGVMLASHDELGGRKVRHVCLPAELAENVAPPELRSYYVDGLMDPKRLGRPVLAEMKKTLSAYAYAGQFGQCLVAGTLVTTGRGPVPIERVCVGDTVLTRHGWRDVLWSGRTGATSRLSSALFSDGSVVTGTGNHPVWCEGVGWVPLDALSGGMYNVSLCQDPEAKTLRSFGSTAETTSGAGGAGTSRTPTGNTSTAPCGFTTRALSPLATTSITRTATRLTIELRIWSASLSASMACATPTARRSVAAFLMRSARLLSRGIGAKRVKRIIARAVGRLSGSCGTAPPTVITFAVPAGDRSGLVRSAAGRCTARPLVKTESGCGLTTRSAPTAAGRSRPPTTVFPPAPAPVRLGGGVPAVAVYDITVDGTPEFFANGVLVHNSPVPLGGGMFRDYYFNQRVKAAPYQAKRIRYWDRASTEDGGCFTAGVLMAKDADGNFYVEHCVWGQWEPYERNQRMLATAIRDRSRYGPKYEPTVYVEAEGGSSGKDAMKGVVKALAGFHVVEDRVTGDKVTRANPWSAQLAAKNVYLVSDDSWDLDNYVREHCLFPLGRYKDQVDASCLVAGTLVETSEGRRPVEQIHAGEFVLTRKGYREVVWAGQSGTTSTVVTVYFADGSFVSGTKDHLVWTQGRGYISLYSLREDDVVLSVGRGPGPCRKKVKASASSAGRRSAKTTRRNAALGPAPLTGGGTAREENTTTKLRSSAELSTGGGSRTGDTSGAAATPSTAPSGVITTETSPVAMTFTTRTETRSTTSLVILNALLLKNTPLSTPEEGLSADNVNTWNAPGNWRLNGTDPTRVGDGTRSTASSRGRVGGKRSTNAVGVLRNSSPGEPDRSSVPPSAERRIGRSGREGDERKNVSVLGAKKSSPARAKRNAVPGSAGPDSAGIGHSTPVYDLTVDGEHEFFANGILVHNSGAFNLLTGMRADVSIRCMPIRPRGPKDALRLVVASEEAVRGIAVDEKSLLVRFQSLTDSEEPLKHGLVNLLDTLVLRFESVQPKDCQETWGQPVHPFGLPAIDLIMNRDHGKKIWAFLTKKRDPPASAVVFVDDKDRALAAAYAVCDVLRPRLPTRPRPQVFRVGQNPEDQHDGEAENRHVYDTVRACRGLVVS